MIKKILILASILTLLPLTLRADNLLDSLLRLDSLRASIEQELNNSGILDPIIDNFINRAAFRVCTNYPAIERIQTLSLHVDSTGAQLNNDFLRIRVAFKEILTGSPAVKTWIPLIFIDPDTLSRIRNGIAEMQDKRDDILLPVFYYTQNNKFFTFPKLDKGPGADGNRTFIVKYYAKDTVVLQAGNDHTAISFNYRDALIDYAIYRIHMSNGNPKAQAYLQSFFSYGPARVNKGIEQGK